MALNGHKVVPPADEEGSFREPMAEVKAAEAGPAHEQALRRERSSLRWALLIFAVGACLLLLSYVGWLPARVATLVAGSEDRANQRFFWLLIAGMGLAFATLSYLDLRVLWLGTERAIKQASAAKVVAKWFVIAGSVFAIGMLLLLLGLVLTNWLASDGDRFPYSMVSYLVHWPTLIVTLFVIPWFAERTKPAGLIFAVIVLGALLVIDMAVGVRIVWDDRAQQLPVWMALLAAFPNVLIAPFLLWGIVIAVRKLCELITQEPIERLPNATDPF
jgi:hypothetical protein